MKKLALWAWVAVLGTALSLSWWSLDALALRYGMPKLLAGVVSLTFDGAALVAADLALRRALVADSAAAVKLLMVLTVGLSAWLNFEHAVLLGYPVPVRVMFAAPSVISGWLFDLQLRGLRRHQLDLVGRVAPTLPRLGLLIWVFHPFQAVHRVSQIAGSRLHSVPVTVMDWEGAPMSVRELTAVPAEVLDGPVVLAAPVETEADEPDQDKAAGPDDGCTYKNAAPAARTPPKAGRSPVPDELYLAVLRKLVEGSDDVIPSAREAARKLSIGQDRARRLLTALKDEVKPEL
jgi:hypothetical protein